MIINFPEGRRIAETPISELGEGKQREGWEEEADGDSPRQNHIDRSAFFMENPRTHQRRDLLGGVGSMSTPTGLDIYYIGFGEGPS